MEGHEIRPIEEVIEISGPIGGQNLAAEAVKPAAHGLPDAPVADDPDRRAVKVSSEHQAGLPGEPLPRSHERLPLGQPPGDAEHQREGEVGGGLREHVGRVADRYAARGGGLDVHVVDSDGVVRDRAQPGRGLDQLRVDGVGEERQKTLQLRRPREQLVARRRQAVRPHLHVVERGKAVERASGQVPGYEHACLGTHWVEEHGRNGGVREDA